MAAHHVQADVVEAIRSHGQQVVKLLFCVVVKIMQLPGRLAERDMTLTILKEGIK